MTQHRESIFKAVREACYPATWSRGVELTRADTVVGESVDDEEAIFRITTRGGMICPKVTLFPADLDWDCECPSREPACEHVAAAVIAWNRSAEKGGELPKPTHGSGGRVGYRFRRAPSGLAFERVIVGNNDEEQALEATLAAVADGRVAGPRFLATQGDLAVELALETHRRGVLPQRLVPRLFKSLAGCGDIRLDGKPVKVAAEQLLPRVHVEDQGDGFLVRIEPDPIVTERLGGDVVRCGDTLRFLGDPRLTARERDELKSGRHFDSSAVAELVTDVLPSLRRRLPVDISTARLPETIAEPPRVLLDMSRSDRTLSVLATLVYGDPPRARIDGTRLVHLQGTVPLRDEKAERSELRRLSELGLAPGIRVEFCGVEAVAFKSRLATWRGSIRGKAHEYFALAPPLVPDLQIGPAGFDITFESSAEAGSGHRRVGTAEPGAVMRAWREGESLVPLMGGGWAPLPVDWLNRFGHRIADLLAARGSDGAVPRCCQADLARLCDDLDEPVPAELGEIRRLVDGFEGIPETRLPGDLATPPRPYQERGVDWLVFLREAGLGALLADDMGLGKTLQALCAVSGRTLVVCPTSVLHNWADEIRTHRPALSHHIYHGPRRKLDPDADVTLTTYALLRLDADRLADVPWDTVVLDEAQNIKNPDSQVTAAAYRLNAGFCVTLTGTPVENRLDELWSQFHFINRGLLGGRRAFRENYAEPIARGDGEAAARLRERIRPFVLRRLKKEVAKDLPPRTEMVLHCELTEEEREIYDAVRASTLNEVVRRLDSGEGSVMAALEALLRLRQAACHGALLPGQEVADSSKLRLLMEALESVVAEGHKALVFSQWTSLLDLTEPHLRISGMPFLRLDGSTRNRAEVVRQFQEDGEVSLMLISLKAGGTGLNLTAADHIFLLDPWWNPAVEDQAADRAHRIGQERPVMIYRLVAEGTVEERIIALQQRKRELADVVLGGADRAAGLTRDDLLELLR